ncbi:MAG: hypothetical protein NTY38_21770 [Acidobacteria bacterium]|nr:hypothetical protein [Acidobacteriota bacterium]
MSNPISPRALVCGLLLAASVALAAPKIYIIPHTHWEGAVFKTREEYLEMGLPHIEKALYLLRKYPHYRFVLDQMCYVKPFLDRYPQEEAAFRQFLGEGRLQIAGATDSMHDSNIPCGESIVRQYLLAKRYFRDRLGYDVTTGWGLDTFGHNAQMPQILKLAGMKSYWFQRGVPDASTPSEFLWKGIDGSTVPAFWLPISYAPLNNLPVNAADFAGMVASSYRRLDPFSRGPERVLFAGADVWEPEELLPQHVTALNALPDQPYQLQIAVPRDFEQAVERRGDRPVIAGELNPIFQGIYSTRIDVKQALRRSEQLLLTAEKLGVLAGWLGTPAGPVQPGPRSRRRRDGGQGL